MTLEEQVDMALDDIDLKAREGYITWPTYVDARKRLMSIRKAGRATARDWELLDNLVRSAAWRGARALVGS